MKDSVPGRAGDIRKSFAGFVAGIQLEVQKWQYAGPGKCCYGKPEEYQYKEPGRYHAPDNPGPVSRDLQLLSCMRLVDVKEECAEKICPVTGKKNGADEDPAGCCRDQRPDAKREICIPHFELKLRVVLPPSHPYLVGPVVHGMADETDDSHETDDDRGRGPYRKVGVDKEKEDACEDPDHGNRHGHPHQKRGFVRCWLCFTHLITSMQ